LWAGVDIDEGVMTGREACEGLAARGVLSKETHGLTLRLSPPLVIEADEIDWMVDQLKDVLAHGPGWGTP
jgi:ornithine--oxo-acid transaminase